MKLTDLPDDILWLILTKVEIKCEKDFYWRLDAFRNPKKYFLC